MAAGTIALTNEAATASIAATAVSRLVISTPRVASCIPSVVKSPAKVVSCVAKVATCEAMADSVADREVSTALSAAAVDDKAEAVLVKDVRSVPRVVNWPCRTVFDVSSAAVADVMAEAELVIDAAAEFSADTVEAIAVDEDAIEVADAAIDVSALFNAVLIDASVVRSDPRVVS